LIHSSTCDRDDDDVMGVVSAWREGESFGEGEKVGDDEAKRVQTLGRACWWVHWPHHACITWVSMASGGAIS